ncbi:hypothetical protein [Maricaulis sp.]|uniref:hypothetical protein n=1 Tax=Maricaulis sp. TaxID=1486257 RepID=UPI003A917558
MKLLRDYRFSEHAMSQNSTTSRTSDPVTPWYNPDVSTLHGAQRAIRPALWLTGAYAVFLVVQFIIQRIVDPAALGDYDPSDILVVTPVFTAALILFALKASRIACGLMLMSGITTIRHGFDVVSAGDGVAGAGLIVTGLALTGLCAIGFAGAWRYHASGGGSSNEESDPAT